MIFKQYNKFREKFKIKFRQALHGKQPWLYFTPFSCLFSASRKLVTNYIIILGLKIKSMNIFFLFNFHRVVVLNKGLIEKNEKHWNDWFWSEIHKIYSDHRMRILCHRSRSTCNTITSTSLLNQTCFRSSHIYTN